MQNISSIDAYRNEVPRQTKLGKTTAQEATWSCPECGLILPYQVKTGVARGRWIRNKCVCQIEEAKLKDQDEISEVQQRNLITKTFSWLGAENADLALATKTFSNFERKEQMKAYDAARNFADDPKGSIILHSEEYGSGKTHLLVAVCNEIRLRNIASHFTTAPKLFRAIQDRINRKESYDDIIFKAITVPFLVIDDVDKAKPSEFREERYFDIIDERTKAGRPTGITTNKFDDLEAYVGEAVYSRLSMGQVKVKMEPKDYRKKL